MFPLLSRTKDCCMTEILVWGISWISGWMFREQGLSSVLLISFDVNELRLSEPNSCHEYHYCHIVPGPPHCCHVDLDLVVCFTIQAVALVGQSRSKNQVHHFELGPVLLLGSFKNLQLSSSLLLVCRRLALPLLQAALLKQQQTPKRI